MIVVVAAVCSLLAGYLAGVALGPISSRWCPDCGRTRECLSCDQALIPGRRKHDHSK